MTSFTAKSFTWHNIERFPHVASIYANLWEQKKVFT